MRWSAVQFGLTFSSLRAPDVRNGVPNRARYERLDNDDDDDESHKTDIVIDADRCSGAHDESHEADVAVDADRRGGARGDGGDGRDAADGEPSDDGVRDRGASGGGGDGDGARACPPRGQRRAGELRCSPWIGIAALQLRIARAAGLAPAEVGGRSFDGTRSFLSSNPASCGHALICFTPRMHSRPDAPDACPRSLLLRVIGGGWGMPHHATRTRCAIATCGCTTRSGTPPKPSPVAPPLIRQTRGA